MNAGDDVLPGCRCIASLFRTSIRCFGHRFADRERSVTSLPFEFRWHFSIVVDPLRRIAFDQLDRIGDRKRRVNLQQQVHMIFHTARSNHHRFVLSRSASHVREQIVSPIRFQQFESLFRAEDGVNQKTMMC